MFNSIQPKTETGCRITKSKQQYPREPRYALMDEGREFSQVQKYKKVLKSHAPEGLT